jgi:formylglycine-generating enzyme required for sulfatase activity
VQQLADNKTDQTFIVGDVTFKMVFVEGGPFQMGSDSGDDDERPVHNVTVSDFYMGEFEVTQALWQEVMGTTVYQQRDKFAPSWSMRGVGVDYPMYYVNYAEAEEFCGRLNQRLRSQLPAGYSFALPTEAEWEYAARGGNKTNTYTYSGSNYLSDVAWYADNSNSTTHAAGSKRANELGLYDMSGNVWEWCTDWYGSYSSSSQTDPRGPSSGSYRVLRGGSWYCSASNCRVAYRNFISPSRRFSSFGFRLALVHR